MNKIRLYLNSFINNPLKVSLKIIKYTVLLYIIWCFIIIFLAFAVCLPLQYYLLNPRIVKKEVSYKNYEIVEYVSDMNFWDAGLYWHLKFPVGINPIPTNATCHYYEGIDKLSGYYGCLSNASAIPEKGKEFEVIREGNGRGATVKINYIFDNLTGDLYVSYWHD